MATAKRPGSPPGANGPPSDARRETVQDIARRLSSATDALNAKLGTVEKTLVSLRLGVSARVNMTSDEGSDSRYASLALLKRGSQWGLYVLTGDDQWPDAREEETPLLTAPKKHRVAAAEVINDLLAALIAAARQQLEEIERASMRLDEALAGDLKDVALADDPLAESSFGADDEIPF